MFIANLNVTNINLKAKGLISSASVNHKYESLS